jgi:hypothetical protein
MPLECPELTILDLAHNQLQSLDGVAAYPGQSAAHTTATIILIMISSWHHHHHTLSYRTKLCSIATK